MEEFMKRNLEPLNSAVISEVQDQSASRNVQLLTVISTQYKHQYSNLYNHIIYLGNLYIRHIRILSLFFEKNKFSKIVLYKGVNFWSIFKIFKKVILANKCDTTYDLSV
jgi:hypothetical protein